MILEYNDPIFVEEDGEDELIKDVLRMLDVPAMYYDEILDNDIDFEEDD
jgi:hypothetical protein